MIFDITDCCWAWAMGTLEPTASGDHTILSQLWGTITEVGWMIKTSHTILPDDGKTKLKVITIGYRCSKAIEGGTQVWNSRINNRWVYERMHQYTFLLRQHLVKNEDWKRRWWRTGIDHHITNDFMRRTMWHRLYFVLLKKNKSQNLLGSIWKYSNRRWTFSTDTKTRRCKLSYSFNRLYILPEKISYLDI